jgi:hypothetical protein
MLAAAMLLICGPVGAADTTDTRSLETQVAETVNVLHDAALTHSSSEFCRLVVLYARLPHCEMAIKQLHQVPIGQISTASLAVRRVGQLVRADVIADVHRGDDRSRVSETLWLAADKPTMVIRPGRLALMSLGLDSDDAATDARPLVPSDLGRPAQGTIDHVGCPTGKPALAIDPARDVTKQPLGTRRVTSSGPAGEPYDIRRVDGRVGRDGSACFTLVFAKPIRVGLGLQLSLTQTRVIHDTRRGLATTSVLIEPGGRTALGAVPAGATVDIDGRTVRLGFKAGAMLRSVPWRLDLLAYAANSDEPLLRDPRLSAYDEAVLKS